MIKVGFCCYGLNTDEQQVSGWTICGGGGGGGVNPSGWSVSKQQLQHKHADNSPVRLLVGHEWTNTPQEALRLRVFHIHVRSLNLPQWLW